MRKGPARLIGSAMVLVLMSLIAWGFFIESERGPTAAGENAAAETAIELAPSSTTATHTHTVIDPCATPPIPTPTTSPTSTPLPSYPLAYLPLVHRSRILPSATLTATPPTR
jgi:hypothetical protein